jgi:hypothetical protein
MARYSLKIAPQIDPDYLSALSPQNATTGELRLLWAYLERCCRDLIQDQPKWHGPQDRRTAALWLESNSYEPFSLSWTCEHLGVDAHYLRLAIKKARKRWNPSTSVKWRKHLN